MNFDSIFAETQTDLHQDAARMLQNGTVTAQTTFADLDDRLRQNVQQNAALRFIKHYWATFPADSYTVEQANTLIDLTAAWFLIDQKDFAETFTS